MPRPIFLGIEKKFIASNSSRNANTKPLISGLIISSTRTKDLLNDTHFRFLTDHLSGGVFFVANYFETISLAKFRTLAATGRMA